MLVPVLLKSLSNCVTGQARDPECKVIAQQSYYGGSGKEESGHPRLFSSRTFSYLATVPCTETAKEFSD